jgi:nondiscriminating glutamyl-tRNA synthetase
MTRELQSNSVQPNPFSVTDVLAILRNRQWLMAEPTPEHLAWCERAASLLGPQVQDLAGLENLLQLVFEYSASAILQQPESHAVLARHAAREVLRHLALLLLDPQPFTSEKFKEVVAHLKDAVELRSRDLFHPLRLALAGRSGEGALDRVILLLDEASALLFAVPVKSVHTRIIEFCAHLD